MTDIYPDLDPRFAPTLPPPNQVSSDNLVQLGAILDGLGGGIPLTIVQLAQQLFGDETGSDLAAGIAQSPEAERNRDLASIVSGSTLGGLATTGPRLALRKAAQALARDQGSGDDLRRVIRYADRRSSNPNVREDQSLADMLINVLTGASVPASQAVLTGEDLPTAASNIATGAAGGTTAGLLGRTMFPPPTRVDALIRRTLGE